MFTLSAIPLSGSGWTASGTGWCRGGHGEMGISVGAVQNKNPVLQAGSTNCKQKQHKNRLLVDLHVQTTKPRVLAVYPGVFYCLNK